MRRSIPSGVILLALVLPAVAGAQGSELAAFEATLGDLVDEMRFDRSTLGALADALRPEEPALAELIEGIDSVEARRFELDHGRSEEARGALDESVRQLKDGGWSTLVQVVDDEDRVEVLMRSRGGAIEGLVALFMDDDEAGLASVNGSIEVAEVMGLLPRMGNLRRAFDDLEGALDRE